MRLKRFKQLPRFTTSSGWLAWPLGLLALALLTVLLYRYFLRSDAPSTAATHRPAQLSTEKQNQSNTAKQIPQAAQDEQNNQDRTAAPLPLLLPVKRPDFRPRAEREPKIVPTPKPSKPRAPYSSGLTKKKPSSRTTGGTYGDSASRWDRDKRLLDSPYYDDWSSNIDGASGTDGKLKALNYDGIGDKWKETVADAQGVPVDKLEENPLFALYSTVPGGRSRPVIPPQKSPATKQPAPATETSPENDDGGSRRAVSEPVPATLAEAAPAANPKEQGQKTTEPEEEEGTLLYLEPFAAVQLSRFLPGINRNGQLLATPSGELSPLVSGRPDGWQKGDQVKTQALGIGGEITFSVAGDGFLLAHKLTAPGQETAAEKENEQTTDFIIYPEIIPIADPLQQKEFDSKHFIQTAEVSVYGVTEYKDIDNDEAYKWVTFPCQAENADENYPGCAGTQPVLSNIVGNDPLAYGGDFYDLQEIGVVAAKQIRIRDTGGNRLPTSVEQSGQPGFRLDSIALLNAYRHLEDEQTEKQK